MTRIYLDNAATTRVTEPVLEAMLPYLTHVYGNASSSHAFGREAHAALDRARAQVAGGLGAQPDEIYFTGSGTEANNWAIFGAAQNGDRRHIITSQIEHHAVMHPVDALEARGFRVTRLPVDSTGTLDPAAVEAAITPDTALVSVMWANNEVGSIQPIPAISAIARAHGALMHTDAVQAVGALPIDVRALPIDLMSLSGHKLHAPKGVGALYIRRGVTIAPLMRGGAQERGLRPGTENVASIVGLGEAVARATGDIGARSAYIARLRDKMIEGIARRIPLSRINALMADRLPGIVNVSIPGADRDALIMNLDLAGIAASSGSACTAGSAEPSHVLMAMGLSEAQVRSSIRLSLSDETTAEEVERALDALEAIAARITQHPSPHDQASGGHTST